MPEKGHFRVFRAKDGGVAYGLEAENGKITPISDAVGPTERIQGQLNQSMAQLSNFSKPVLIMGLYPGNELLFVYDFCEKTPGNHAKQPIYVCIDSFPCFFGFLQAWDVRRVLADERVHFFMAGETGEVIADFQRNPERPYAFTLLSGAPAARLNQLMPPFASLVVERDRELERMLVENELYYNMLSDEGLAKIISGGGARKPRILMPTCSWSTFVQHSTRDLCAAMEHLGWETRVINTDAMLTKYYLAHQINTFKPDVFLFIDHLRGEAADVYPANMLFVTWVQDEMDHFFQEQAGTFLRSNAQLRKRDLLVGYVDRLSDPRYGYPRDRLVKMSIPADTNLFKPVILSADDQKNYGCDLAFASNVSTSTERLMEEQIIPELTALGFGEACLCAIHDHLWAQYRQGRTFSMPAKFERELRLFPAYAQAAGLVSEEDRQRAHTLLYWRLNNAIYRHVALEWADELGLDIHLYGEGWERHPRFAKYARPAVTHGEELNKAYQGARVNLHLNVAQGMHQRIWELLAAHVPILMRSREPSPAREPPLMTMQMLADSLCMDPFGEAFSILLEANSTEEWLVDWIFRQALHLHFQDDAGSGRAPTCITTAQVLKHIRSVILARPDYVVPVREAFLFDDKASFAAAMARVDEYRSSTRHPVRTPGYEFTAEELTGRLLELLDAPADADPALKPEIVRPTMYGGILDAVVKLAALFAHHTKTVREAPKDQTWINPILQAFEEFPLKTHELRVRLADVLAHAHRPEAVLCCLPDNIANVPLSDDVLTRLAGVYIACGDLRRAAWQLSRVREEQRYAYWHTLRGTLDLAEGRYVSAMAHLNTSQDARTDTLAALAAVAVVIQRATDNPTPIIDAPATIAWLLDQAAALDTTIPCNLPASPSMQDMEGLYHLTLWAHRGNHPAALRAIRDALAFNGLPESASALARYGTLCAWLGFPDKSVEAFEQITRQYAATEPAVRMLIQNQMACRQFQKAEALTRCHAQRYANRYWWQYYSLMLRHITGTPVLENELPTMTPEGVREDIFMTLFGSLAAHCGHAHMALSLLARGGGHALAQVYTAIAHREQGDRAEAQRLLAPFKPVYENGVYLAEENAARIAEAVLVPFFGLTDRRHFWNSMVAAALTGPCDEAVAYVKKSATTPTGAWQSDADSVQYPQQKQGGQHIE
ncbi:MAG: hypothetical protein EOM20_17290 [Spartobacteria bacterium]|nr:hypothetical protein [Spartobacteria bacterium]